MNELELKKTADGIIIHVSVKPKAKRESVSGVHAGDLKVAVNAPPEKGKANAAVVSLLAGFFGVPKNMVELKSGATSKKKTFLNILKARMRKSMTVIPIKRNHKKTNQNQKPFIIHGKKLPFAQKANAGIWKMNCSNYKKKYNNYTLS